MLKRIENLNRAQNQRALQTPDEKLNVDLKIDKKTGLVSFNWHSPKVLALIKKLNPEAGEKMMGQGHFCG